MSRNSLWSQSGSFWIGAFMLAEMPLGVLFAFLPRQQRDILANYAFFTPLGIALTITSAIALGLTVGWAGHRLGFGE
ncbi:MAG: hypothetical protein EOO15_14120 [Chitinophagaceae bacterium]|nr:MAG: hypothetical protein EOO15_14120 [Chitinophagaceae bacterium]